MARGPISRSSTTASAASGPAAASGSGTTGSAPTGSAAATAPPTGTGTGTPVPARNPRALGPYAIADLYERWTLDSIVEIAHAIAKDFVVRPTLYARVGGKNAKALGEFLYLSGTDPAYPDFAKRQLILAPLLGPSDGLLGPKASTFQSRAADLREKARAFAERQVTTGEDYLRRAFVASAISLKAYLQPLVGNAAVGNSDAQSLSVFSKAESILLDSIITGVFGQPAAATAPGWPINHSYDDNGALAVEYAARALAVPGPHSQSQFIVKQQIASYGSDTLRLVLGSTFHSTGVVTHANDEIIDYAYNWKRALDALAT